MDIKQLEQFVAVAREGGFARAAKALSLSQPTLTRNIAALEASLGVILFSRTSRGVALTEDGSKLISHAHAILDEIERTHAEFAIDRAGETVRLGVSPNLLFSLLPAIAPEVIAKRTDLRLLITTGTYETLAAKLREHELDVGLCLVPDSMPHDAELLVVEPIGQALIVPVARADHPVFAGVVDLDRAATHRWAVPHQLSLSYRFESVFYRRGLGVPRQAVNTASISVMRMAVADWGLLGMLPLDSVADDITAGKLLRLPIDDLVFGYTIGMITCRSGARGATTDLVMAEVRRHLAPMLAAQAG